MLSALPTMAITDSHPPRPSSSSSSSSSTTKPNPPPQPEVLSVKCDSCSFTEDCTAAYITRVRERYQGRWICGLCVEAVKDEALRSDRLISTEEALNRHISFCKNFRLSSKEKTEHPILAMGRIFRRSLDTPRALRSSSSSSLGDLQRVRGPELVRSGSCFPALNS